MPQELRHFYSDDHSPLTINNGEVQWQEAMRLPVEEVLLLDDKLIVQGYNCIKRNGIHTVGHLVSLAFYELNEIRNYGKGTHGRLANRLAESGLCFAPHQACKDECANDCVYTTYLGVGKRHLPLAFIAKLPLENIRAIDTPCYGLVFGGKLVARELVEMTPTEICNRIESAGLHYFETTGYPPFKQVSATTNMREAYVDLLLTLRARMSA